MFSRNGYYEAIQCSNIMQGALAHGSSPVFRSADSINQHDLDNYKVTSFAIEDLCNTATMSSDVALELGLEEHIGKELPPEDSYNWGPPLCSVQQHLIGHHITDDQQENPAHLLQEYNAGPYPDSEYTVAPDLLNHLQIPACNIAPGLPPTLPMLYDAGMKPSDYLDLNINLSGISNQNDGIMINDPALHSGYAMNQPHLFKDLHHPLLQNSDLFMNEVDGDCPTGIREMARSFYQNNDGSHFDSVPLECGTKKRNYAKGREKKNFTTEKERREQINVKYDELKSLLPSPTKPDRASVVGAAIDYINELNGTIKELKNLLERRKYGNNKRKKLNLAVNAVGDMESSSMRPNNDDNEQDFNEMISSSWVQRKTKDCHIDVRRVDDEVNIKISQKLRTNGLLCIAKVLDDMELELIHVVSGTIGDHHIFMFNLKLEKNSSIYACAVAKRLLEAIDRQYPPLACSTGS